MDGYVYFIQCGNDGPIKIGFGIDPKKRLKIAQVYNPVMLVLLTYEPGSRELESFYHIKFDDDHIYGEWFLPSERLKKHIDALPKICITCEDFRLSPPRGYLCHNWKGELASESSKRQRGRRKYKIKDKCERCGRKAKDVWHKNNNLDDNSEENLQSLCRRCRMELDGTLDSIKHWSKNNPRCKDSELCCNCGKEEKYLTQKRCHTCYCYFLTHNIDRKNGNNRAKNPVPCIVCGKVIKQPAKGKCHTCYEFFRRNGFERILKVEGV
jgi:hypothetical protein